MVLSADALALFAAVGITHALALFDAFLFGHHLTAEKITRCRISRMQHGRRHGQSGNDQDNTGKTCANFSTIPFHCSPPIEQHAWTLTFESSFILSSCFPCDQETPQDGTERIGKGIDDHDSNIAAESVKLNSASQVFQLPEIR
jgi:hypothetical protein